MHALIHAGRLTVGRACSVICVLVPIKVISEVEILSNIPDSSMLDAPDDVEGEELRDAARLADEATALGKVIENVETPRTQKESNSSGAAQTSK